MSQKVLNLFIVFIIQRQLPLIHAQNLRCQKVDFNRPTSTVNEFGACLGESLNVLKINAYAATTIEPFRPASQYHLSATAGLSCLQSTSHFTLDENSEIRSAIFLNWVVFGAWVTVQIVDENGGQVDVVANLEQSDEWVGFYTKVNRSIENAQIEIRTNMNMESVLAIEYLHILNSDLPDGDCTDIDTDPPETVEPTDPSETEEPTDPSDTEEPTDPPETEEPTDSPETEVPTDGTETEDPTGDPETDVPTNESVTPSDEPTEPGTESTMDSENTEPSITDQPTTIETTTTAPLINSSQTTMYIWMGLSFLFFITTVGTLAASYYFVWLYRKVLDLRPLTSNDSKTTTNLPRLIVLKENGANGDHVIVGVNKC